MKKHCSVLLAFTIPFFSHAMDDKAFVGHIITMHAQHDIVSRMPSFFYARGGWSEESAQTVDTASRILAKAHASCWQIIARAMSSSDTNDQEECRALCQKHAPVLSRVPMDGLINFCKNVSDNKRIFNSALTLMLSEGIGTGFNTMDAIVMMLQQGAKTTSKSYLLEPEGIVCKTDSLVQQVCDVVQQQVYMPLLLTYTPWRDIKKNMDGLHPVVYVYKNKDISKPETHELIRFLIKHDYFVGEAHTPTKKEIIPECAHAMGKYTAKNSNAETTQKLLKTFEMVANTYYDREFRADACSAINKNMSIYDDVTEILTTISHNDKKALAKATYTALRDHSSRPDQAALAVSGIIVDYVASWPAITVESLAKKRKTTT